MWRTRAVLEWLVDDLGGLRGTGEAPVEALAKARRRGRLVAALDAVALAVLFLLREPSRPFLPFGPTTDAVFTLAVLAVAAHAGFRLGQAEKHGALERLARELEERSGPATGGGR